MSEKKTKVAARAVEGLSALEGAVIRRTWHQGRWWFVVVDVVAALTDSRNPDGYLRDLRRRDEELSRNWESLVTVLRIGTSGGPQMLSCASLEGILRVVQSVPSAKAEPFKLWLAKVGNERFEELQATDFDALSEDQRCLLLRGQMAGHNKDLAEAARQAGVETPLDYAVFQDYGYKGLYGGLGAKDIHARKGLKKSQKILDHMGSTELAANLFRATQAEEKLRREQVKGKSAANRTHQKVGETVRRTIQELGGTLPEELPKPEKSIQQIQKAAKSALGHEKQK